MKTIKNKSGEPMLIAQFFNNYDSDQSGFFEEVEFSKLPKKVKVSFADENLGGCGLGYNTYFRSNTHGETYGKCFVKVTPPIRYSLKNELNSEELKGLSLQEGINFVKMKLDRNISLKLDIFEYNDNLHCNVKIKLIRDDYVPEEHKFIKYEKEAFEVFGYVDNICYQFSSDLENKEKLESMKNEKIYDIDEIDRISKKRCWM